MGPRSRLPPHEQAKGAFLAHVQAAFSVPTSTSNKSKMAFSMFYTAAVTFPFVVTITSWLYLSPFEDSVRAVAVSPRALQFFSAASCTIFNSLIAAFEITILSSVRKQEVHLPRTITRSVVPSLTYVATCKAYLGYHCNVHRLFVVGLHWALLHRPIRVLTVLRSSTSRMENAVCNLLQHYQYGSERVFGPTRFACVERGNDLES